MPKAASERHPAAPSAADFPASPSLRPPITSVAVMGLGYVGLPTSLALAAAGFSVTGVEISRHRRDAVLAGDVDLLPGDHDRLRAARDSGRLAVTGEASAIAEADAVMVCVPTPVSEDLQPDLSILKAACAQLVAHARPGQTLLLTSTSYIGCTADLVIRPLRERGLACGRDLYVAFAPERINPGDSLHAHETVPRVYGAQTPTCAVRAEQVLARITARLHQVSSPEAAEMTKLYENTFRAVNIALANEMAAAARLHGLSAAEVTDAAATKPYGFLAHYPGPGVGGHCIPCDPHYLLAGIEARGGSAPLISQAMHGIDRRPAEVAGRALELLDEAGVPAREARVLVAGVTYKPGVQDTRESPAIRIIKRLSAAGAQVDYWDPGVPELRRAGDPGMRSVPDPGAHACDLVVFISTQPGARGEWLASHARVLDCTYRLRPDGPGQRIHQI